jgi:TonB family protein
MRLSCTLFLLIISFQLSSQNPRRGTIVLKRGLCQRSATDAAVFIRVDSMPDFRGGGMAGDTWMRRNVQYPEDARRKGIEGVVVMKFIVMPDGSITRPEIVSSTNKVFNEECMRLILLMPKWKPGKCQGSAVPVEFKLPMKFSLPRASGFF